MPEEQHHPSIPEEMRARIDALHPAVRESVIKSFKNQLAWEPFQALERSFERSIEHYEKEQIKFDKFIKSGKEPPAKDVAAVLRSMQPDAHLPHGTGVVSNCCATKTKEFEGYYGRGYIHVSEESSNEADNHKYREVVATDNATLVLSHMGPN